MRSKELGARGQRVERVEAYVRTSCVCVAKEEVVNHQEQEKATIQLFKLFA